jgi:flagellin
MTLSVNNNAAAQLALQSLNNTTEQLSLVQTQIDTSKAVNNASDNAAVWAIAQGQTNEISALSSVTSGLNRASSIVDVGVSAGQTVSDLLSQIKTTVLSATDSSIDTAARGALNTQYESLLNQIQNVVQSASFDGVNVLDGSSPSLQFLANASGTQFLTVSGQNLSLGGPLVSLTQTASITTATNASSVLAQVTSSIAAVNSALGALGSQSTQIGSHITFVNTLSDALNTGIGNLVDADLAADSARLQALQVQQQLGVQAAQIANSSPQTILSLFKNG